MICVLHVICELDKKCNHWSKWNAAFTRRGGVWCLDTCQWDGIVSLHCLNYWYTGTDQQCVTAATNVVCALNRYLIFWADVPIQTLAASMLPRTELLRMCMCPEEQTNAWVLFARHGYRKQVSAVADGLHIFLSPLFGMKTQRDYHSHFTALCPGLSRWASTRRINHSGFCWSIDVGAAVASAEPYASHLHLTPDR